MRLMVIGHSFLQAVAQRKYVAMKRAAPDLALKLLTLNRMPHLFKEFTFERNPGLDDGEAQPLTPIGGFRSNMTYVFPPRKLYRCIREFAPHIIHMEEEPHALITAETALLAQSAAPKAVMSAFVWDNLFRARSWPLSAAKSALDGYSLGRCRLVVCGSQEADRVLRTRRRYTGPSVVLPQSDVDPDVFAAETDSQMRGRLGVGGVPCVGYIGRMVPEKGVEVLLEALSQLLEHRWKLLLVGSGPLSSRIEEYWKPRLPDRIVLVPAVSPDDVARYHRSVDIFVLPSYGIEGWREQFGLTLAQAMMAGRACVGTSSGAIPDTLGSTGLVVPERDSTSLAAAIERLLIEDDARLSLGAAAREFAVRNYSTSAVAAHYLAAFQAVLN